MTSLSSSITGAPSYPPLLSLPLTLPKWESLSPSLRLPLSRPCSHRPSLRGPLTFPHLGSLTQFLTQAPSYTPHFKLPGNLCHSGSLPPSLIVTSLSPSLSWAPSHPHSLRHRLTFSHLDSLTPSLSQAPSQLLSLRISPTLPHWDLTLTIPHSGSLSPSLTRVPSHPHSLGLTLTLTHLCYHSTALSQAPSQLLSLRQAPSLPHCDLALPLHHSGSHTH